MSLYGAIATVRKRLARAQAERDGWHAAGNAEKYRAACTVVDALRQQLDMLEASDRRPAAD